MNKGYRPTEEYASSTRRTIVVDASKFVLGRLAAKVAYVLRGKHKVFYTPGVDGGDKVIVFNTDKVQITGKKLEKKIFYKHTGYIGNMKAKLLRHRMEDDSTEVFSTAVKRMLPKGPLGRRQLKRLSVFTNEIKCQIHSQTEFDFNKFFGDINA